MNLINGWGEKYKAMINRFGALCVSPIIPDLLPIGTKSRYQFFHQELTGLNTNSSLLAPEEKIIESNEMYDIFIMNIVVLLSDSAIVHNKFGNIAALPNGFDVSVTESKVETFLIEKAQTGGQLIAKAGVLDGYGGGADSFELTNWTGSADAQTARMDLSSYVPGGVRIGRGTHDKFTARNNDDLTGLDEMTVHVFGYKHLE